MLLGLSHTYTPRICSESICMELFCYFNLIVCMCVRVRACLRSVIIEIGYGLHERGSIPGRGWGFLSLLPRPERFRASTSLLSNGHRDFFPWE